ncbi:carboxypeptidase-like regulatory domain-containing protein, partial [Vibrio parahaemolyticus]
SFLSVFGQNRVIKGTVLDAEGKPVSGASVFAKGAKSGVITGKDGSFTLQVAESVKAVEITSLGFEKKEIIIGANGIVNISLDKKYDP